MRDQTFHWSGYASAKTGFSLISLTNNSAVRACTVKIERCDVLAWAGSSNGFAKGAYLLKKISGISDGGVDVPIVGHNPSYSLPAQVKCAIQCGVQLTGEIPISKYFPFHTDTIDSIHGQSDTIANYLFHHGGRGRSINVDTASFGRWGYSSPDVQGIVLNEGDGISIVPDIGMGLPPGTLFFLTATIHDLTNNRTYTTMCDLASSGSFTRACFALMNETGSGVRLSVQEMSIQRWGLEGHATTSASYTVGRVNWMKTRGMHVDTGEPITMVAADPRNTLPSTISLKRAHMAAGKFLVPKLDINGLYEGALGFVTTMQNGAGWGGTLTETNVTENKHGFSSFRQSWPNSRPHYTLADTGFLISESPSFNKHGEARKGVTSPVTLAPGEGMSAMVFNFMGDRVFASFGEVFAHKSTYYIELTISYNSGVNERAVAST